MIWNPVKADPSFMGFSTQKFIVVVVLQWKWSIVSLQYYTAVSSPSRADFRIFEINIFFHHNFFLYRLYVTIITYEWTLITLCTLQASWRHAAGQTEIQPLVWNHTSPIEKSKNIFFKAEIFFDYSYRENKICFKSSMARVLR